MQSGGDDAAAAALRKEAAAASTATATTAVAKNAPPPFALIAHRGDSHCAPENTIAAFDLALAHGFRALELDAQLARCGTPVVVHCEALGRTTGGAGEGERVSDWTYERLSTIDAGGWFGGAEFAGERIPRLEDVLNRYHGRAHLHIELKSTQPGLAAAVAACLERCGWVAPGGADGGGGGAGGDGGSGGVGGGGALRPTMVGADGDDAAAAEGLVAAPGLTVTSFHPEQLARSKEVSRGLGAAGS